MNILAIVEDTHGILIKPACFSIILVFLYFVIYKSSSLNKMYRDNKRAKDLLSYERAETYYYTIKTPENILNNSEIQENELFMGLLTEIKDKIKMNRIEIISYNDLKTLEKQVSKHGRYIYEHSRKGGMADKYYEFHQEFMQDYLFNVHSQIEKGKLKDLKSHSCIKKNISIISENLNDARIPKNVKGNYKGFIDDQLTLLKCISYDCKDEIDICKKKKIIGRIEGNIIFIELFRTLPVVPANESSEFKNRIFRIHMNNYLDILSSKWQIIFGSSITCTAD
ncbi:hypothetical protein NEPAR04_0359 [Nematocida parisii]|nr:hypothetical protein NEPAR03_0051 [Nematocida parisii]KAI5125500.1 hypothetical protein NEPAR08_0051 [Nematocida parisii]KAI5140618.1 hypothetical protein NEPAR04_0359 [Nematocida parisii]